MSLNSETPLQLERDIRSASQPSKRARDEEARIAQWQHRLRRKDKTSKHVPAHKSRKFEMYECREHADLLADDSKDEDSGEIQTDISNPTTALPNTSA
jgi:hypothetical protein